MMIVTEKHTTNAVTPSLEGKVAFVTGASRGIGAAIARELAGAGAFVTINYVAREREASDLRDQLGETAGLAQADVTSYAQIEAALDEVAKRYGKIDILVNNAGILRDRSFKNMREDEWDAVIRTNLTGVFNGCRAVVPHMIAGGGGAIVNMSSVIGLTGNFGQANYAAAKAGIIGLTKTLALELARHKIRVNAVCPGFVGTEMWNTIPQNVRDDITRRIPLGRVADPREVAHAVRYLIDAAYVTGETLNVNGGLAMH